MAWLFAAFAPSVAKRLIVAKTEMDTVPTVNSVRTNLESGTTIGAGSPGVAGGQITEAVVQLSEGVKQRSGSVKQSNAATELRDAAWALHAGASRFKV